MNKVEGPAQNIYVELLYCDSNKKGETWENIGTVRDCSRDGEINRFVDWMIELLHKIWDEEKITDKWRNSVTIPIFKNKCDVLKYEGYREMVHGLLILESYCRGYEMRWKYRKCIVWIYESKVNSKCDFCHETVAGETIEWKKKMYCPLNKPREWLL